MLGGECDDFCAWMERVDRVICGLTGLTHEDLIDYCWRDQYEDGTSAHEAALEVLEELGLEVG